MAPLSWVLLPALTAALNNGLVRTPILGYNTYNDVACSPNTTWLQTTMNAISSKGLAKLGYKFFQLDCGWQGYNRQANGSITYDATAFPTGIRPLADLAISLGLEWSMYTDQGVNSCDTRTDVLRPGSLGYEKQDALQFAGWNVAYMKADNCYITAGNNAPKDPRTDFPTRYGALSTALQNVGIGRILICQWGTPYSSPTGLQGPSSWAPAISTSYRVSDDIATGWNQVLRITNEAIRTSLLGLSGPGAFADMDLLEVGNPAFTFAEQQTHFAIWATFKSPLMISTNIPSISAASLGIVSNTDLIAVNQDSLGQPIKLVQRFTGDYDLYQGNLANGDRVVLLFDQTNKARTLSVSFADLGIQSADVRNLWTGKTSLAATKYSQAVSAHGSLVLRLSAVKAATAAVPKVTYLEYETAALSGGASVASCTGCSGGKKVGNLAAGTTATLSNVRVSTATADILFDYINCEVGYSFGDQFGPNVRGASFSINGGAAQVVEFPLTGYNWDKDLLKSYRVRLNGFNPAGTNTIAVTAATSISAYAPDFDRIGISS